MSLYTSVSLRAQFADIDSLTRIKTAVCYSCLSFSAVIGTNPRKVSISCKVYATQGIAATNAGIAQMLE